MIMSPEWCVAYAHTGTIPASLGNAANITHIVLNNNSLTGSIPNSLGGLPYLFSLQVSNNSLTG